MATKEKKRPGLWLFKEEPEHYSFAMLEKDGSTRWDGVTNNLARQHLRQVRKGDMVLYYHTGREKAIVGEMKVVSDPYADSASEDPKAVVVDVKPVKKWPFPVTLARIKKVQELADWDLVRMPRLSVMPVTPIQWNRLVELGREHS